LREPRLHRRAEGERGVGPRLRLPVFEAGKYLLAFDGAALLLLELWGGGVAVDSFSPHALDADLSSV
jgi:hypothetical protein